MNVPVTESAVNVTVWESDGGGDGRSSTASISALKKFPQMNYEGYSDFET